MSLYCSDLLHQLNIHRHINLEYRILQRFMLSYGSYKETFDMNFKVTHPIASTLQILVGFSQFLPYINRMARLPPCATSTTVKTAKRMPVAFKLYHNTFTSISGNLLSQLNHYNTHQTT